MASDEKLKALDAAISNIEKQFGKGSIMKLGESNVNLNVESIPTGSLSLDIALHISRIMAFLLRGILLLVICAPVDHGIEDGL